MNIMFKIRTGPDDRWTDVEQWPNADRVPGKGELVRAGGREMRVLEILQTGSRDTEVYLVPTYVDLG